MSLRVGRYAMVLAAAVVAACDGPPAPPTASAPVARSAVQSAQRLAAKIDHAGPRLNSLIAFEPGALDEATERDRERREGKVRGPLHGVTVVVKDNIETAGPLPTTAGSLALAANVTHRDAPLVARLREAGAVILAKANLSEWANFRSNRSVSGWSAVGGLVRNPYALDRSACGSSSGTAVAVSVGLAVAGVGTETDGSIICPAATNGVVGLKPTLGLISRRHIVPISPEQDTAGPIATTVRDAAALLTAMAGSDAEDPATSEADARKVDYVAALDVDALRGARIGVMRGFVQGTAQGDAVFERALATLRDAGATLVDVPLPPEAERTALSDAEGNALRAEFRVAISAYLGTTPVTVTTRDLPALIAFNASTPAELSLFAQETFELAAKAQPLQDPQVREWRTTARRLAGPEGLDRLLRETNVEALVAQTSSPATPVDLVNGTRFLGSPSTMPAVAGYPHLTVPMGEVRGLPVGLSFIGPQWSDARVLALGHAFETRARARRAPTFLPSINVSPEVSDAYDPH